MEAVVLAAVLTLSLAIAVLAARTSLSLAISVIERSAVWTARPSAAPLRTGAIIEDDAAPARQAMAA